MRQALKPILFDDNDKATADATRASVVAQAERSKAANQKAATKRTPDGLPVHSFRSVLADLATVTRNTTAMTQSLETTFVLYPTLRGRPAMGAVMIKCPHTGHHIKTGMVADRTSFERTPVFFARAYCSICRREHEWFAKEAWVCEVEPGECS